VGGEETADERLLVGIVNDRRDITILDEERWYRIPTTTIDRDPRDWPPTWFAAFERVSITRAGQQVLRYAKVRDIVRRTREDLFPGEPAGTRAGREYYQLLLEPINKLDEPLVPRRPRRNPFIRTTLARLLHARDFNDLFSDATQGGYEDQLWQALEAHRIPAERQWELSTARKRKYVLDFAVFCERGGVDVEVDGRRHHYIPEQSEYDSDRNNDLEAKGWKVLRYRTAQIRESLGGCLAQIGESIQRHGGLADEAAPPRFGSRGGQLITQLSMFEERAPYDESSTPRPPHS
jgi:very-short-patch-repair endonuclease